MLWRESHKERVPLSPKHPDLVQGREDELRSAFWLEAPGGYSPHHHRCAVASCIKMDIFLCYNTSS